MNCPIESVLIYWFKNLPAWGVALYGARLAYKAAMSWKQEFISKRQAEAAEKILTSLHSYISELRRCRSGDGKYPYEASHTEIEKAGIATAFETWRGRVQNFDNTSFLSARAASISSRIHFSERAHKIVEDIIAIRLIYINAFNEGTKVGQSQEQQLRCARILLPSRTNDDGINRANQLLRELESLILERI